MDRKLVICLALSSLLLSGCSIERKGQLRDTAVLYVTYATFSDYYKNGDFVAWSDTKGQYEAKELQDDKE